MYEDDDSNQVALNVLPAFRRHKRRLFVAILLLFLTASVLVFMEPPIYVARSTVMVETQQIPMDLVQSTVTSAAHEQIDMIRQRVMTRENLLSIISKYDHFGVKHADPQGVARILDDFRRRIEVDVSSTNNGWQAVAIGFNVSFGSETPTIAQSVTNDLVDMFLSENVKARTQRASETTEFLKAEADKIRAELSDIEATVADYKRTNSDALPEHLNLYTSMREDVRKRLAEIEQKSFSYEEQIRVLSDQLASLGSGQADGIDGDTDLAALREQYRLLLGRFQPRHPDVVALKQQIAMLQLSVSDSNIQEINSVASIEVRNQIELLRKKVEFLAGERRQGEEKLADLHERIIRIPQVERGFVSIKRNYEAKLDQYERIAEKSQNAEMAESLEQQKKAERFTLLERPVIPTAPSEPNRAKLLMLAAFLSVGFPGGLVFLVGMLDRSIRDTSALERITGSPPLIGIPYLNTREEVCAYKRRNRVVIASLCLFVLFGALLLHNFYMPFDVVLSRFSGQL